MGILDSYVIRDEAFSVRGNAQQKCSRTTGTPSESVSVHNRMEHPTISISSIVEPLQQYGQFGRFVPDASMTLCL
jgi:hypothetical protein